MNAKVWRVAFVAGAAASAASGQVIDWSNPGGGDWNNAANWSPMNVPNAAGETPRFNIGGSYAVSYPLAVSIGGLEVLDPGATINMTTGTFLGLGAATATNHGLIVINSNSGGAATILRADQNLTLSGTGRIRLSAIANLDTALLDTNGTTLVHGAGHTISGTGRVRAAMVNNGLVLADAAGAVLELSANPKVNNAVMRAVSGGVLQATGIGVDQAGGGQLVADNATVNYVNGSLTGGTVSAVNGGAVAIFGAPTFVGVTFSSGTMNLPTGNSLLVAGAGLTNHGVITVNSNTGGAGTQVRYDATGVLAGTGDIVLQANPNLDTAQFNTNGTQVTQEAQHDLRGTGRVRANLVNNGRLIADQNGLVLELLAFNQVNNRTLRAQNGGILQVSGITITQGVNGQINTGPGGQLVFVNAAVAGGVVDASGGAATILGSPTFQGVTSVLGPVNIPTGNALLVRGAGLVHDGVVTVNSNAGGAGTLLRFDDSGVLAGPGTVELNANPNLDTAQLNTNATTLTHAAGHTIKGTGRIRAALTNNGAILADRANGAAIELLALPVTNNADLRATGGGLLQVNGITLTQNPSTGVLTADPGSTVNLVNATVSGGHTDAAGTFNALGTVTLTDVHHVAGPINVPTGNAILVRGAGLENDGTITINSSVGGAGTLLRFDDSGTLSGAGEVVLTANANLDTAQLNTNGTQVTQAAGHTIRGTGRLRASLTNEGLIAADRPGAALEVLAPAQTNRAEMRADAGTLQVNGTAVTQGPGARITAVNGGVLSFVNATVTGGVVDASGGAGAISGATTFNGVEAGGAWSIPTGNSLLVNGGLRNDGVITVNSNTGGAGTQVRFDSPGGFTGAGRLVLNANPNLDTAQLGRNGAFVVENGPDHTIAGNGRVRTPVLMRGAIAPGLSAGVLEFIGSALDFEPTATYRCEVGGTAPSAHDRIAMNGGGAVASLDGTLAVALTGGFVPGLCDSFTVVDGFAGGSVTGAFADLTVTPALPPDRKMRLVYTGTDAILRLTCYPDFNADCALDIFDFLEFQNLFAQNAPEACDCDTTTGPAVCDIFDFLCFQNAFFTGCP